MMFAINEGSNEVKANNDIENVSAFEESII